jgi:uroporphyrinogen decarboxylase
MTDSPPLLEALAGRRPARTPIWFMRQAGRFLPEYRELRANYSFLDLLRDPAAGTEVTLMPLRRFAQIDAAILFTDLLVPLEAMGVPLEYTPGPELGWTFATASDLERFEELDVESKLAVPLETARRVRAALPPEKTLIGFVGAPWTLGAYMVEGQGSKTWARLRGLAWREPEVFSGLMDRMADAALAFGLAQRRAGCDAIQVFDSWAGVAEPSMFREQVLPSLEKVIGGLRDAGAPIIYYVNGAQPHLETMLATGAECLGVDWRVEMAAVDAALPAGKPVQGNLDPTSLFARPTRVAAETRRILEAARGRPHIFNLGHGLEPTTPIEGVAAAFEAVRAFDAGAH